MEIMFDDLTPEAQERLLEEAGISTPEDMDWDQYPVAVVNLEKVHDDDEDEEDYEEPEEEYDFDLNFDEEEE